MTSEAAVQIAVNAGDRLVEAIDWVANHGNPRKSSDPAKPWWWELVLMRNYGIITPWDGPDFLGGEPTPLAFDVHRELVRLGRCEPIGTPKPF